MQNKIVLYGMIFIVLKTGGMITASELNNNKHFLNLFLS
jgi:hypothetical protein